MTTRYSTLFAKTKRDAPADISDDTLRLAYRAGLIRPVEAGQFIYLPLAADVLSQMMLMLRAGLKELGAQEIRSGMEPHLDALGSAEIQSYKQLPARIYWYERGSTQLQLASFEATREAALETQKAFETLARDLFDYASIAPRQARDVDDGRVWYTSAPQLDLQVLKNSNGEYAATRVAAVPLKMPAAPDPPVPLEEIETPHCDTIEALAQLLQVPTARTAKAIFYSNGERVFFAVIRGDLQIDEFKVKRVLGVETLRWATEEEIKGVGAVPGYASPIGTRGATVIVDDSIINSPNLVAGANKTGYHFLNTNVPRDYKPDVIADIALAHAGDPSPDGSGELELVRGAQIGALSAPRQLDAGFLDLNGKGQKQLGVALTIDLGAALLAHIAAHHDDKGILWSRALAPFDVHIIVLNGDKPEVAAGIKAVSDALERAGLEAIMDDRNESAGVKFNDADLLGLPLRITAGPKTLAQGAVEFKPRTDSNARLVPLAELDAAVNEWLGI